MYGHKDMELFSNKKTNALKVLSLPLNCCTGKSFINFPDIERNVKIPDQSSVDSVSLNLAMPFTLQLFPLLQLFTL